MRIGQVALLAAATACGNKLPAGSQVGAIPGAPLKIQAVGDTLIVESYGDEKITEQGPLVDVLALPMAGGALRTLGVLLQGPLVVDGGLIYYATNVGGDLYLIKSDGPQHLGHHVLGPYGIANGMIVVDGGVIVVGSGNQRPDEWKRLNRPSRV